MHPALKIELLESKVLLASNSIIQCMVAHGSDITDNESLELVLSNLFDPFRQNTIALWVICLQQELHIMTALIDKNLKIVDTILTAGEQVLIQKMNTNMETATIDLSPDAPVLANLRDNLAANKIKNLEAYTFSDPAIEQVLKESVQRSQILKTLTMDTQKMTQTLTKARQKLSQL